MRIMVIGPRWQGQWTGYCVAALRGLGHQVAMTYYDQRSKDLLLAVRVRLPAGSPAQRSFAAFDEHWTNLINRSLVRRARRFAPDLVLLLKGESLSSHSLAEIKHDTKAILATWWLDDPFRYAAFVPAISLFDHFFVFDRSYIPALLENGAKAASYLPCGCDVDVLRPMTLSEAELQHYGSQVCFVGCHYPQREELLSVLEGFDLGIWGPGWQRNLSSERGALRNAHRGWATPHQAAKIYNASAICLNAHHQQTRDGGLNFRTFELAACRAFQLVDYVVGIEKLFEVGKEIACYRDSDELRRQVRHYSLRSDERMQIASQAHIRLQRDHTLHRRMETLLRALSAKQVTHKTWCAKT